MRFAKVGVISIGLFLAIVALAATLSAQGSSNNGNSILAAIQALQQTVDGLVSTENGLVSTVNAIDTTVDGLSSTVNGLATTVSSINTATAPGNVLFTPVASLGAADGASCLANNVVNQDRDVTFGFVNAATGTILANFTITIPSGRYNGLTFPAAGAPATYFCSFTVEDGTKNDIRAVLQKGTSTTGFRDPIVAQ